MIHSAAQPRSAASWMCASGCSATDSGESSDRQARFGNQLLGCLVQANQRTIAVVWPCIDGQHVFHRGYERTVGLRRDNPALSAMGLEDVFLSARPIVLSLARSTMPSSTTLFSSNRRVQRTRPLGGFEQARATSLASFSPSKIRATPGVAGIAPCSVKLCEAVVAVNDVKRPSQFGQERD